MRFHLSKIIPVPMKTTYFEEHSLVSRRWWQWRNRIYADRAETVMVKC